METLQKILAYLLGLPRWSRVVIILAAALSAIAVALSSCARSSMRFKGTGDVEYIYKGVNGPQFASENK